MYAAPFPPPQRVPHPTRPSAALINPSARWVHFGELLFPHVSPQQGWRGIRLHAALQGRIASLAGEREQTEVLDRFPLTSPGRR